jgi:NAD(P)-dependent dehydrogenase (short-subunit alcohol dehydrogenase family)
MGDFDGQRVAVIGGSSGIGFAVARRVLEQGAEVVIGSSERTRVEGALARLGDGARGCPVDVRDEDSVGAFFEQVGTFEHLVFTAGDWGTIRIQQTIAELDLEQAHRIFGVRFWGALSAIKHAQGHIAQDGSVTVTDGLIAHRPRAGAAVNTAMAGAVEHLTRALAVDLAPLRVNAVCPGFVLTEVWDGMPAKEREARIRSMTERQPLPRAADPAEVAEAYLYLMRGTFATGQVLIVDGGMSLV